MRALRLLLPVAFILAASATSSSDVDAATYRKIRCPKDPETKVRAVRMIPTDCRSEFEQYARERSSEAHVSLDVLRQHLDVGGSSQSRVAALADRLDQISTRYRDTLVSMCQSFVMDPCNAERAEALEAKKASLMEAYASITASVKRIDDSKSAENEGEEPSLTAEEAYGEAEAAIAAMEASE